MSYRRPECMRKGEGGRGGDGVRSRSALSVATVSSVCRLPPFRTGKRISGSRLTPTPARLPARSGLPGGLRNAFTCVCDGARLQALVYDILPPPTALTDYTARHRSRKLSANGQLFVGAQRQQVCKSTQIIKSKHVTGSKVRY